MMCCSQCCSKAPRKTYPKIPTLRERDRIIESVARQYGYTEAAEARRAWPFLRGLGITAGELTADAHRFFVDNPA